MGKTKKDLGKMAANLREKIAKLEEIVRKDPLHKDWKSYDELTTLKKKMAGN